MKYWLAAFSILSIVYPILGQKTDTITFNEKGIYRPAPWFGIHIDQDFFADFVNNEDRNYTQGTAFSYTMLGMEKNNFTFIPLNLFYKLGDLFRDKVGEPDNVSELAASILFGVTAYTPLELRSYIPAYGDRPYSALLFVETKRSRLIGNNFHSWSFTYSILGTNVGKEFQSFAHRNMFTGRGVPLGWDTQVSQGGHFAWLIKNSFKAPLRKNKYERSLKAGDITFGNWDGSYGIETAVGYYTYFGASLGGRIGRINFRNYFNNKTSFLSSGDAYNFADNTSKSIEEKLVNKTKSYWEHFLFVSISPRLFANNNLISGQPGVSSGYSLDSKYVSSFVTEFEIGLASSRTTMAFLKKQTERMTSTTDKLMQFSFSIKARSPEISYPGFSRMHYWGCLTAIVPIDIRDRQPKTALSHE